MISQDFTVEAGDDYTIKINLFNNNGGSMSINGSTLEFTFNNVVKTSKTNEITLTSSDTLNLNGNYPYKCRVIDSLGRKSTVVKGNMIVEK